MVRSAGQHALSTRRGQLGGWSADECRNLCGQKCTENRTKNHNRKQGKTAPPYCAAVCAFTNTRRHVNVLQSHSVTRFNSQENALKMHRKYIGRGNAFFCCRLIWFRPPGYRLLFNWDCTKWKTWCMGPLFRSWLHCNENPLYIFLFWEWRGLSPNFNIHVSVSDLYSPRIGLHISSSRIGRPIAHRQLDVEIGTEAPIFLLWDYCICFEISVFCLCSV